MTTRPRLQAGSGFDAPRFVIGFLFDGVAPTRATDLGSSGPRLVLCRSACLRRPTVPFGPPIAPPGRPFAFPLCAPTPLPQRAPAARTAEPGRVRRSTEWGRSDARHFNTEAQRHREKTGVELGSQIHPSAPLCLCVQPFLSSFAPFAFLSPPRLRVPVLPCAALPPWGAALPPGAGAVSA